jgi:putative FmdB family regulatory protein
LPTYEYACTACGHRLEAVQKFTDEPLSECPECGSALRKVYGAVGIVLKGSGFYKTDSRAATNGKSANKDSKEKESSDSLPKKDSSDSPSKTDGASKDKGSKDAKPAAAAAT